MRINVKLSVWYQSVRDYSEQAIHETARSRLSAPSSSRYLSTPFALTIPSREIKVSSSGNLHAKIHTGFGRMLGVTASTCKRTSRNRSKEEESFLP